MSMRKNSLLLVLLLLTSISNISVNAQVIVARMADLANAATNSPETKATLSTTWKTDVEGGAVYEFSGGKYLGGIVNDAVVEAMEGDKYVTIAMWVYGRTSSLQSVFGYGDSGNGLSFQLNSRSLKITAKGSTGFTASDNFNATNMPEDAWYLVAYTLRGKASSATTNTYRYLSSTTNGQYFTKNDHKFCDKVSVNEASRKFAIGSGCQGEANSTFTGKIANLTVIRSNALLNNQSVLSYVGAAPIAETDQDFRYVTINYTAGSNTFQRVLKVSGESFDVPTPDYYTNVTPSSFNNDGSTTSYNVTCTDNFPVESGKFYSMTIRKHSTSNNNTDLDKRSIYWNGSDANINSRTASATAVGMGSYWRFERVPNTENKVRLYSNSRGLSHAVNFINQTDGQAATCQQGNGGSYVFAVKPITVSGTTNYANAFRLANPYVNNCNVNDVGGNLGFWVNDNSVSDAGSAILITEVETPPTEITTATYRDENNVVATYNIPEKGYYWNNTASTEVDAPTDPGYMTNISTSVTASNVLSVNYTNNFPFVVSTDDAKYYQSLKVRNDETHYVTAAYNSGSVTEGTTKSRNTPITEDADKQKVLQSGWAFVKEPGTFNKFRIYNEATGNLQLYLPNENNKTNATMAEQGTAFVIDLQPSEFNDFTGGFTIRPNENNNHALGDHNSGPLAYWTDRGSSELNNDGSIFRVADEDVYMESVCNAFYNSSKGWVAKLINQSAPSVSAYNTAHSSYADLALADPDDAATMMPAYRQLAQAYYKVKYNMLSEDDANQKYRLRTTAFTNTKYLSIETNANEGLKTIDPKKAKKQLFTFPASTTQGKFEIGNAIDEQVVSLDSWNVAMNATKGSGGAFTITYVGDELYTITHGSATDNNYFAPGELQGNGSATIYNNQAASTCRIHWALEPVSTAEANLVDKCDPLSVAIDAAEPYENFYNADKAGLPGYLSTDNEGLAATVDNAIATGRQLLEHATESTDNSFITGAITYINDNVELLKQNLVSFPTNRYFSIQNNNGRGYLTYEANAEKENGTEFVWTTVKTPATTFDAENTAHLWCFLAHEKADHTTEYYLYNAGKKQFARPTKEYGSYDYTWIFSDEPAAITLHHLSGHQMMISAQSVEVQEDNEVYASVSTGFTGPVISYNEAGDGGLPFLFDWGTAEYVASSEVQDNVANTIGLTEKTASDVLITGIEDGQTIATYSSDKAFKLREGVTAYTATATGTLGTYLLNAVEPGQIIPGGQGVILVGESEVASSVIDIVHRGEPTDIDNNALLGSGSGTETMQAGDYILAKGDDGIGFYQAIVGTTLKAHKAYIRTGNANVRALQLNFGGQTTDVNELILVNKNTPVYDMTGRRVTSVQKGGIYIQNGRKFIVK